MVPFKELSCTAYWLLVLEIQKELQLEKPHESTQRVSYVYRELPEELSKLTEHHPNLSSTNRRVSESCRAFPEEFPIPIAHNTNSFR